MIKVIHYLNVDSMFSPCGRLNGSIDTTDDKEFVECKSCLKIINKTKKEKIIPRPHWDKNKIQIVLDKDLNKIFYTLGHGTLFSHLFGNNAIDLIEKETGLEIDQISKVNIFLVWHNGIYKECAEIDYSDSFKATRLDYTVKDKEWYKSKYKEVSDDLLIMGKENIELKQEIVKQAADISDLKKDCLESERLIDMKRKQITGMHDEISNLQITLKNTERLFGIIARGI